MSLTVCCHPLKIVDNAFQLFNLSFTLILTVKTGICKQTKIQVKHQQQKQLD